MNKIFYSNYAKLYDLFYSEKDYKSECEFILESIIRFYSKKDKLAIIDFGCGTGEHSLILSKKGHFCRGIDLSEDSLQRIVSYRVWGGRLTLYYTSTPTSLATPLPEGYISVSRSHLSSFLSADRGGADSPEPPLSSEVVLAGEWWKLHAPGC